MQSRYKDDAKSAKQYVRCRARLLLLLLVVKEEGTSLVD